MYRAWHLRFAICIGLRLRWQRACQHTCVGRIKKKLHCTVAAPYGRLSNDSVCVGYDCRDDENVESRENVTRTTPNTKNERKMGIHVRNSIECWLNVVQAQ